MGCDLGVAVSLGIDVVVSVPGDELGVGVGVTHGSLYCRASVRALIHPSKFPPPSRPNWARVTAYRILSGLPRRFLTIALLACDSTAVGGRNREPRQALEPYRSYSCFSNVFQRVHASSRAFRSASRTAGLAGSPERMKP